MQNFLEFSIKKKTPLQSKKWYGWMYIFTFNTNTKRKKAHPPPTHPLTHSTNSRLFKSSNFSSLVFFRTLSLSPSLSSSPKKFSLIIYFFFNYFSFFDHFVVFFLLSQILFNFTFLLIYFINGCSKYLTLIYSSLLLLLSQFYKYHYYHLFYFLLCFVLF